MLTLCGVFLGLAVAVYGVFLWSNPEIRLAQRALKAKQWDYAKANAEFQSARRIILARLRHPEGAITKGTSQAALDLAVACADRLNQLGGKAFGGEYRTRLRSQLQKQFQREADYWVSADYGLDTLGRDQEPALFAAHHNAATKTH